VNTDDPQHALDKAEVRVLEIQTKLHRWARDDPGRRVSSTPFQYLSSYTWGLVIRWLRRKHRRITWKELRRRFCGGRWWPGSEERELFNPAKVRTTRYRYRVSVIPSPWPTTG
jgi:RNA-directed DNA polymerase